MKYPNLLRDFGSYVREDIAQTEATLSTVERMSHADRRNNWELEVLRLQSKRAALYAILVEDLGLSMLYRPVEGFEAIDLEFNYQV